MSNSNFGKILLKVFCLLLLLNTIYSNAADNLIQSDLQSIEVVGTIAETINKMSNAEGRWFTYQVQMEPNNGMPCCLISNSESICSLDKRSNSWSISTNRHENSKLLNIYFKMANQVPTDLFLAGSECKIEVDDNIVTGFGNVTEQQSLIFLKPFVHGNNDKHRGGSIADKVLAAIALHKGVVAHELLEEFVSGDNIKLRHKSVFWLGEARNKNGYDSLLGIVDDTSNNTKTLIQAIFALSVNSYDKSSDKLVELAKTNRNTKIQGEAVFWLAQNHKDKAAAVIDYLLLNSGDIEVKKKTVFSLAQIKTKQSWNQLIRLAQNNADRTVQEEAIFWLSQDEHNDPVSVLMTLATSNESQSIQKKAVFALSQLRPDKSIPALMGLMMSSSSKLVKKEALFWLGQSHDPKALDYLESVLTPDAIL